ncbi:MAG TPA: hypothetical protein VMT18_05155 [Planctomycetota bacterium]|nr:hypothetical protein [Planctomycetota bacterium]
MLHTMLRAGALTLLVLPATAGVITVDDSGGADFSDLPAAIAAAQPGDVLLVEPGSYSGFLLQGKPLAILGQASGQVIVNGSSQVAGIPLGSEVVLADLDFWTLELSDSDGVIVVVGVRVFAWNDQNRFFVHDCADVRTLGLHADATGFVLAPCGQSAVSLSGPGRVEIVDGFLEGRYGVYEECGERGLLAEGGVSLLLAGTSVLGGDGGDGDGGCGVMCFCPGYPGGDGAWVRGPGTRVRITGLPDDVIVAGETGWPVSGCVVHACPIKFSDNGDPDSALFHSGVDLQPTSGFKDICEPSPPKSLQIIPPEPLLELVSQGVPGSPLHLRVHGRPGDAVLLKLGRSAVVEPIPGVMVERLTSEESSIALGVIPLAPQYVELKLFKVPVGGWPPGATFFAQARILRNGAEWRTNSVPIVWR